MRAVTVQFDHQGDRYKRLLDVFVGSWKEHSRIPLEIYRIPPPQIGSRNKGFYYNHRKLQEWVKRVDGDTILVDCDMLLMSDISRGFENVEHIGITQRRPPFPYNGGCVFVRDNKISRDFLQKWLQVDRDMLHDPSLHLPYRSRYAGINQSSLGWMLENGYKHLTHNLPETYNLCDGWPHWKQAKMIHVKGRLRRHVLGIEGSGDQTVIDIKKVWGRYVPKHN